MRRRRPLALGMFDVDLLRRLREGRGWSLRELSMRTGLSNPYLCQLETRQILAPSFDAAVAIATAFEVTINTFVRRSPRGTTPPSGERK